MSRTVVGACAGVVAGLGTVLTYEGFSRSCLLMNGRLGCAITHPKMLPLTFAFWAAVATVLIALGFQATRHTPWLPAAVLGGVLWVVLITVAFFSQYTDPETPIEHRPPSIFPAAAVVVPCIAYAFATSVTGRARP